MAALLEVTELTKRLGNFTLENISFSLAPGYIMGVIGVNGSGKTSLLRTILNLYQQDSGSIRIAGFDMNTSEKQAKEIIGTVLDEDFFDETLTPEKNAAIFGPFYPRFDMDIFREACKRFEIPLDQKVKKLSRGIRTRLQFAFALSHRAKLYLMDEPAGGLDPRFRRSLIGCMQELVESGERSVIFSTHLTEDLDKVADYILMLHEGKVQFCLDKEALCQNYRLIRGTKEEIESLPKEQVAGKEHSMYHSEALIRTSPGNPSGGQNYPAPKLSEILYYLERGYSQCGN
ncbi:ABC transporter ATP-binding protein [Blautia schinkii]|nr:ABC transporter ATP-binding protein [Blautia schinkii]